MVCRLKTAFHRDLYLLILDKLSWFIHYQSGDKMADASPLGGPFTAEDRPLSVWSISEDRHVGTHDAVTAQRLTHAADEDWPVQAPPGRPIGVQLVRGAIGGGNDWALVVDGVTCDKKFKDLDVDDFDNVPVCQLPAPFSVTIKKITSKTLVRPMAITVRLEEEALAPESVHVVIQQVVYSSERSSQSAYDENEVRTLQRIALPVHSSRDTVAPSLVLPYPMASPPQSALGIVSYREVEKWYENVSAIAAQNKTKKEKYDRAKTKYDSDYKKWSSNRFNARTANISKRGRYTLDQTAWLANGAPAGQQPAKPKFTKLPKWIRPGPSPPDYKTPTSGQPEKERNFVIGGKELSSARVLVSVYKTLTDVCEAVRADPGFQGISLSAHIAEMRSRLSVSRAHTELAFFETLLTGFVSPVAAVLLKRRYSIDSNGNVTDDASTEEQRDASFGERMKNLSTIDPSNTCQFVYDYVPFEQRQNTYTRIRVVLEVQEHSGERRTIALEPRTYHGMAAHAVYSDFAGDRNAMKKAGNDFLDCLLDVYKDRGVVTQVVDAAADSGLTGWFSWARRKVTGGGAPAVFLPKYDQIEDMVNEVEAVHKRIVPSWPEPLPERLLWDISRQVDERSAAAAVLAEAARQAVEDGADNEFFGTEDERQQGEEALEIDIAGPIQEIGSAVVAGGLVGLTRVSPTGAEWTEDELAEMRLAEQRLQEEGAFQERIDRIESLYRRELTSLGVAVGASGNLTLADPSTLVVRELPQVARPVRDVSLNLVTPVDTAPPDQNMPVENNSASLLAKIVAVGVGWYVFVNKYYRHYNYMTAWVKAGFIADVGGAAFAGFGSLANGVAGVAIGGLPGGVVAAASATWAIYNASTSLAKAGGQFTKDILYYRGESYLVAIPQGVRAAHTIIEWSRNSNLEYSKRGTAYWQAMQAARGVPIMSSIAAGRKAFKLIRERTHGVEMALRSDAGASVLYDVSTNQRYYFSEYFIRTEKNTNQIRALPKVKGADIWATVPDTTALFLLPPRDVAECVYEVETLRRLPYGRAASRTAGAPPANVATSIPTLAAKAAYRELIGMVRAERFPFMELTGDQLLSSSERVALVLATSGAKLVEAAYGANAGLTLIDGSDAIWTCLPAGVAARIALRHMNLFVEAETLGGARTPEQYVALTKHWRAPQRAMMDEFATALVGEAKAAVSSKDRLDAVLDTRKTVGEAVASFERARVLGTDGDTIGMLVVASAFSSVLSQLGRDTNTAARIVNQVAAAQQNAQMFEYQRDLHEPSWSANSSPQRMAAAWASRRIDIDPVKAWRPASSSDGVEALLQQMSGLDVADGLENTASYYCPIGSRVEGMPGRMPFAIHDLGVRPLWMGAVARAAHVLKASIQVSLPETSVNVDARLVNKLGGGPGGLVGFARHPMTMTIGPVEPIVRTQLSETPYNTLTVSANSDTIMSAVATLETNAQAGLAVGYRMQRMRAMAYNADRLQNALDLAVSKANAPETLDVRLPHAEACVALCLSMGLLSAEQRAVMHTVQVHVDSAEKRNQAIMLLARVQKSCESALGSGCKVSTLAEACAALA